MSADRSPPGQCRSSSMTLANATKGGATAVVHRRLLDAAAPQNTKKKKTARLRWFTGASSTQRLRKTHKKKAARLRWFTGEAPVSCASFVLAQSLVQHSSSDASTPRLSDLNRLTHNLQGVQFDACLYAMYTMNSGYTLLRSNRTYSR
eukprot:NODE_14958_length_1076_cov_3.997893.p1 GENE.NODE_14958_length_1076_cov_3.997893~~NODE_14958_length_1076_cov_3.997893.p1  ORF type:complete len:148 (-),score=21.94 NODE_14958_length_1076_cov_3.997893:97-540(-)